MPTDTDAVEPEGEFSQEEIDQWGIDYTGHTGEATGEPLKIGYINQEAVFPENTVGINAAIEYVNTELGVSAAVPASSSAARSSPTRTARSAARRCSTIPRCRVRCSTGTLLNGNQQLYDVLAGKKPVIIGSGRRHQPRLPDECAGVGYPTGSVGVIPGLAEYAVSRLDPAPTNVAIVYASNAAGQAGALASSRCSTPWGSRSPRSRSTTRVPPPPTSSGDYRGGAGTTSFIPLVTVQSCIATYDAIAARHSPRGRHDRAVLRHRHDRPSRRAR